MKHNYIFIDYENIQPANLEILNRPDISVIVFVGSQQSKIPIDIVLKMQAMGERARYIKVTTTANNALDFHIAFYMGKILAHVPTSNVYIISKDTDYEPLISHLQEQGINAALCEEIEQLPFLKAVKTQPLQLKHVAKPTQKAVNSPPNATSTAQSPSHTPTTNKQSTSTSVAVQQSIKPSPKSTIASAIPAVIKPPSKKSTPPAASKIQVNKASNTQIDKAHLNSQNEQLQTILANFRKMNSPPRKLAALSNHIYALFGGKIARDDVTILIAMLVKQKHISLNDTEVIYHIKNKKEAA